LKKKYFLYSYGIYKDMKSSIPIKRSILKTFVESALKLRRPVFKKVIYDQPKQTKRITRKKRIKRLEIGTR